MAIDVYCWLTHRNHVLTSRGQSSVFVPWAALQQALGGGSDIKAKFAQSFKQAYEKICKAGYAPRIGIDQRGVLLYQSLPDVPTKRSKLLDVSGGSI